MLQPGRQNSSSRFRFGFNSKEKDDELKGIGNSLDFGERIYDTRLGMFLSLDPLKNIFAMHSPYLFANGNPILFLDVLGMAGEEYYKKELEGYKIVIIKETGESIITKTSINEIKKGGTGFSPRTYVGITTETYTINAKGKITTVATLKSELEFGNVQGRWNRINYEVKNETKRQVDAESKNSDVTKDDLINSFAEFAGKKNEDLKEGDFEGLSSNDKVLESAKIILPVVLDRIYPGSGVVTEFLEIVLPDSKKTFESKKIPFEEAQKTANKFKSDSQ
jgi:RHS repeat-associated protein